MSSGAKWKKVAVYPGIYALTGWMRTHLSALPSCELPPIENVPQQRVRNFCVRPEQFGPHLHVVGLGAESKSKCQRGEPPSRPQAVWAPRAHQIAHRNTKEIVRSAHAKGKWNGSTHPFFDVAPKLTPVLAGVNRVPLEPALSERSNDEYYC